MKIYIGCGLTHVPRDLFEEYVSFIHGVAAALRADSSPHEVKYALVDSDPQLATKPFAERARLCYLWDREMVEQADLLIAEVSFPSTGVGMELQAAESRGTPIILCVRDYGVNRCAPVRYENPDRSRHDLQIGEGYVSLMALGVPSVFRLVKYGSPDDGIRQLVGVVELLRKCSV
jgi:hypothetical protein